MIKTSLEFSAITSDVYYVCQLKSGARGPVPEFIMNHFSLRTY